MAMRGRLRIENKTDYRTDDLRRFFAAGLRAMHASADKRIEVYPSGGRYVFATAT